MIRHFLVLVSFFLATPAMALDWTSSPAVTQLYFEAQLEGTFVLYDVSSARFTGHSASRANTRYIPASTFKIPNSLIGLAVGSVKDVDEVLSYGGKPQPFPQWERDMSLRDAIAISNVPIYQNLARRTGLKNMAAHVEEMRYGNANIGETVDRFWLDGPLRISAVEQALFLARLAQDQLPYSTEQQKATRDIVLLESNERYRLYGKTGWVGAPGPGVGWWIGWVETEQGIYTFAMNIDVRNNGDADKRIPLGKASLKALGVL